MICIQRGCSVAVIIIVLLAAILFGTPGDVIAKIIKIRFSHVVAANTPKGKAAAMFARIANQRLKGRVDVEVFTNSKFYTDEKVLDALTTGGVEMAAPSTSKFTSWIPEFQIFDLPFLFKNNNVFHAAMDGMVGEKMLKLLTRKGMLGLALWDNGYKQISTNVREIILPQDAAGIKYRIMPSKVLESQFKILAGKPRVMPFAEVYSALEQGVVGGQENTWSNIYSKRFNHVQKYISETNHGYVGYVVVTNQQFWNYLPSDVRVELEKILKEVTGWVRVNAMEMNRLAKSKIMESGTSKITHLSKAQLEVWRKTLKPVHDYFKPVIGAELIDEVYKLNAQN